MEGCDTNNSTSSAKLSHQSPSPTSSSSPPSHPPPAPQVVMRPCAACKLLRRRCTENCVFAPYFPPTEPTKFTIAHRVFGASNINQFLQGLPESQRADAVSSMVYEANARIRDPVYGCAGAIYQLQKQVNELQAQLAKAQAELVTMQLQQANPDCTRWSNEQEQLCYACDSCKAGVLARLKKSWRKVSVINIVVMIILVIVYITAYASFRNNRKINNDEPYGGARMTKGFSYIA